jgi:2-haloalkanoic acid dehalogenase type II
MTNPFPAARVLFFDLMGTCTSWHHTILSLLQNLPSLTHLPPSSLPAFALKWREGFFNEIHRRFEKGQGQDDIDITHRHVLDKLLEQSGVGMAIWGEDIRQRLVQGWHEQMPWPDVVKALERLRKKFFVVVLANGTVRLQLDITQSANLPFHMLFSSQLLGLTKPDPSIYLKAVELVGCRVVECVMVAAHVYDLRAAQKVGMGTVYVRRETEDPGEDFAGIEKEVDLFIDGRDGMEGCGFRELADVLGC